MSNVGTPLTVVTTAGTPATSGSVATTYAAGSGSNRKVVIVARHEQTTSNTRVLSTLALGGASATRVYYSVTTSGFAFVEVWRINESDIASIGSNPTLAVTMAAGTAVVQCTIYTLDGRDQSATPTQIAGNNTLANAVTVALDTVSGSDVVGGMCATSGAGFSISGDVAETASSDGSFNSGATFGVAFYGAATGTSTSITGDNSSTSTGAHQVLVAVGFPPASGDSTPPTLSSATVDGTTLTLTFSETVSVGAGGNAGFSLSASGGAATISYSSGSGSSTLVYTVNRSIAQGETITLSYTQPGNGIEDSAGNDLVTFSGTSVTNNSLPAGWSQVTIGATVASSGDRVKGSPTDLATGFKVAWGNVTGTGTVTVFDTGAYEYTSTVTSFQFMIWDGSSWGAVGTITTTTLSSSRKSYRARKWISSKLQSLKYFSRKY